MAMKRKGRAEILMEMPEEMEVMESTPPSESQESETLSPELPNPPPQRKTTKAKTLKTPSEKRLLPSDSNEAASAVLPYKNTAGAFVRLISAILGTFSEPLTPDEREEGTFAISALLYEENAAFGARFLVILWLGGLSVPRFTKAFKAYRKRKETPSTPSLGASAETKEQALQALTRQVEEKIANRPMKGFDGF